MADSEKLLELARDHFKLAVEATIHQREREMEDLRFQVPEHQWDEASKKARMGDNFSPARPMLSITQLEAPIRLTRTNARNAKLGVNIHPVSEDSDDESAEAMQGLYRRIERDSNAMDARLWAYDRAIKCGRGYWRVVTRYDEDSGELLDQEIRIERILHQNSVYLDPAAQEPDWSDGEWAFIVAWLPVDVFKRKYPGAKVTYDSALLWEDATQRAPDWVRGTSYGPDSAVLVAEYWYKVHNVTEIKVEAGGVSRSVERDEVTVFCAKMSGMELLEDPQEWNGKYIPIIPCLGNELQPFDEQRRFSGMITNAKDAQRFYNYAASSLVEGMALEPKAPYMIADGQLEGFEDQWQQANNKNFPYLTYKLVTSDGKPAPPPARAQVDGTRMNLAVMGLQQADQWVQNVTAVYEPSLGRQEKDRSGRAILALQSQTDQSTGDYSAGLVRAMVYEAKVILDLMPKIYDRPGRVTRIIRGDDGKSEQIAVNQPFTMQDGRVQRAQPGAPGAKEYRLGPGYGISVDIGQSYKTRLQEGDEAMTRLLEAAPQLLIPLGDIVFKFKDTPGAKEISKRLAKMREMQMPGLGEGEDGSKTPEQLQMENQRLNQQAQQLQQQLQGAAQALATDQAKQQATVAKAQMDTEAKAKIAQADNETKLIIAAAQEETKRLIAGIEAQVATLREIVKSDQARAAQEAAERERKDGQAHEAVMATMEPPTAPEHEGGSRA